MITDRDATEFRSRVKRITMDAGASEPMADGILSRVGARLRGLTHAEAVTLYPDPIKAL